MTCCEDGPDGSGKSVTLMHILHYCYLKDWLILHVPDGKLLCYGFNISAVIFHIYTDCYDEPCIMMIFKRTNKVTFFIKILYWEQLVSDSYFWNFCLNMISLIYSFVLLYSSISAHYLNQIQDFKNFSRFYQKYNKWVRDCSAFWL